MFGLEARIIEIERRLRKALMDIADLLARMAAAENQKLSPIGGAAGGDGGGGGVYFADHLSLGAASGTLASGAPATVASVSVYEINSGAFNLVTSSGTVYNGMPDACDTTKRQILMKNRDGTYAVIAQSCTSV